MGFAALIPSMAKATSFDTEPAIVVCVDHASCDNVLCTTCACSTCGVKVTLTFGASTLSESGFAAIRTKVAAHLQVDVSRVVVAVKGGEVRRQRRRRRRLQQTGNIQVTATVHAETSSAASTLDTQVQTQASELAAAVAVGAGASVYVASVGRSGSSATGSTAPTWTNSDTTFAQPPGSGGAS